MGDFKIEARLQIRDLSHKTNDCDCCALFNQINFDKTQRKYFVPFSKKSEDEAKRIRKYITKSRENSAHNGVSGLVTIRYGKQILLHSIEDIEYLFMNFLNMIDELTLHKENKDIMGSFWDSSLNLIISPMPNSNMIKFSIEQPKRGKGIVSLEKLKVNTATINKKEFINIMLDATEKAFKFLQTLKIVDAYDGSNKNYTNELDQIKLLRGGA